MIRSFFLAIFLLILPCLVLADGPVFGVYSLTRKASDPGQTDEFGTALAIQGNTLVVGSPLDNDSFTDSGSAYIFNRDTGGADNWGQIQKLNAGDPGNSDEFGFSVDVDGDYAVVGAPRDNDQGEDSGSAYVFYRNQPGANQWGQVAKLTSTLGAAGDQFGFDVAIDGTTVVVGAPFDADKGGNAGSISVFEKDAGGVGNWGQVVTNLTSSDGASGDLFGHSVDIDGQWVVAGAPVNSRGAVYLFQLSGNLSEVKPIPGPSFDLTVGARFGFAVAIEGDRILVGAPEDSSDSGSAFIFERNKGGSGNWGQVAKLVAGDRDIGDRFGDSVALRGDRGLVGASSDGESAGNAGAAYLFYRNAGGNEEWGESDKLVGNTPSSNDETGTGVALGDGTAAAGAPFEDDKWSNSGAVYIYDLYFNQTPVIANQGFSIEENTPNSTPVGTVVANDPDFGQSLTYEITADSSAGAFSLNATNGTLRVADSSQLDYETTTSFALTVQVVDDGTPQLTNSAQVTVNILDVAEGADLAVTKNAVDVLSTTSNLTYTIGVTNFGPATATNVVVVDTLPQGVTYDPVGSGPQCTESNGTVTCKVGNLVGNGGDVSVVINVVVATNTVGLITNLVEVSSLTVEEGPTENNSDLAITEVTDFDGDLDPDFHDPDDDNDLIPDIWELQFGLNPTNAADADEFADSDRFTNLEEYIADTDPTNALSYLKFESVNGPPVVFEFESSTGRLYTIESQTNLLEETWDPIAGLSNFFGMGGVDVRTNNALDSELFFRIDVRLP